MDASQELQQIIANSKTGDQIPNSETLQGTDYLFVYVSGVGFRKIQKDKIVFTGETVSTLKGLTDTPNTYLGQKGKILVVKEDETGFEYRVLDEVSGVTEQELTDALAQYEPKLGNPDTDGKILSSTISGVRTWITPPEGSVQTVTANGTTYSPDVNGDVDLGTLATEGGATHTVFYDDIWNSGSQTFTVSDSSKVTNVKVQGEDLRKGFEWEIFSPTEIRIIPTLDPGNWVWITGSTVSAPADKTDVISYALSSPSADLAAGDTDSFIAPYDFTLNNYFAGVAEAPTGSALVVGLKKAGVSVTSSDAIIDAGETTSLTGTAPTITTDTFLKGDLITPTIVQVGSLTTGKSLKIYLEITKS